jgi:hypothetical protein
MKFVNVNNVLFTNAVVLKIIVALDAGNPISASNTLTPFAAVILAHAAVPLAIIVTPFDAYALIVVFETYPNGEFITTLANNVPVGGKFALDGIGDENILNDAAFPRSLNNAYAKL